MFLKFYFWPMLLRTPFFFRNFHCIADKCSDSCCIGWEVDVDKNTLARYREYDKQAQAKYLQKRNQSSEPQQIKEPLDICSQIENGSFKLQPGNRCPFLRKDGLCEIICRHGVNGTDLDRNGKSVLGDICREHPRFVEVYGDIMEKGLGLCCEEATRLLLSENGTENSPIAFIEYETDDEPDEIPDDAIEARDAIFQERDHLFKILVNRNKPFNERLIELLNYAIDSSGFEICDIDLSPDDHDISNNIYKSWIDTLSKSESFGPAWDSALAQIDQNCWNDYPNIFSDADGEKIIAYLLFRYYSKSLFDGNSLTKVEFALYFWVILQKFGSIFAQYPQNNTPQTALNAKINAIKLFSKQTEYSEEIMEFLESQFMENPSFSPRIFKRIITE